MAKAAQRFRQQQKLIDKLSLTGCAASEADYSPYLNDPAGYARDVLGVRLTPKQEEAARLVTQPPFRVLCPSGHTVGKSFLAACLVNWWFDTRRPGICLTTAPTQAQVNDILWAEVRMLRARHHDRPGMDFAGPKSPRLESAPNHFAVGLTARDGNRFQGRHGIAVLIIFDEAEGVEPIFWQAASTMLCGDSYAFLGIYNPTSQGSQAAQEERLPGYSLCRMSSLEHPNIAAELRGERPLYPSAARLAWLREQLGKWSTRVNPGEEMPGDVRLGEDIYRPGPVAQARLLGIRPNLAFDTVWSDWLFDQARQRILPDQGLLQIGCDVARFGDDDTAIHVRRGGNSLHHESANGWATTTTAQRCIQLAHHWASIYSIDPRRLIIAVDDCGVGGGVVDQLEAAGYMVLRVNASATAQAVGGNLAVSRTGEEAYPNLRSALWFEAADAARDGNLSLARLPNDVADTLRRELTSPTYTLDVRGRRCVEPKDLTKKRLGRSPDNADALLLAYCNVAMIPEHYGGRIQVPT